MFDYAKKFYRFAKQCIYPEYHAAIEPFGKMLKRKKTVSDVLIKRAKKKGYSLGEELSQGIAQELALKSCSQLYEEIEKTKKNIENLY